jgi:hypothetical protein
MTVNYVLRGGRRCSVGNGSWRKSLSDFLVGEVDPLRVGDCGPVVEESGERCTLVAPRTGSWLTRIGERKRSDVELLGI